MKKEKKNEKKKIKRNARKLFIYIVISLVILGLIGTSIIPFLSR